MRKTIKKKGWIVSYHTYDNLEFGYLKNRLKTILIVHDTKFRSIKYNYGDRIIREHHLGYNSNEEGITITELILKK